MVRRDWAPVAGNTAKLVLDKIMTENALDDKVFEIVKILEQTAVDLREGKIPLNDLLITKQLTKNPEEYKDAQGLYHVKVALRMNSGGKLQKKFRTGDTVSYLFCTDGLPHHKLELMLQQQAQYKKEQAEAEPSTSEVKVETTVKLEPDPMYYLAQQVHPVVSRICEPIPGLDGARIAEALGLDPSSYKKRYAVNQEEASDDKLLGQESEAIKYKNCERFEFTCSTPGCEHKFRLENIFNVDEVR